MRHVAIAGKDNQSIFSCEVIKEMYSSVMEEAFTKANEFYDGLNETDILLVWPGRMFIHNEAELGALIHEIARRYKKALIILAETGSFYVFESAELFDRTPDRFSEFGSIESLLDGIKSDKNLECIEFKTSYRDICILNTARNLSFANKLLNRRRVLALMDKGVYVEDEDDIHVSRESIVESGAFLAKGARIEGKSYIEEGAAVLSSSKIVDSKISRGAEVLFSTVISSEVGENTHVGPYAYIRPGSKVGKNCKVGDFVEIKNSSLGDNSKVSHLSYIGDSDVGKDVNIGCGTIFVNYDGKHKYRSVVEDGAFIGCNSNLVSPVRIGERAFIAAGSTITEDVGADSLAIARSRQINKEDWVKSRK